MRINNSIYKIKSLLAATKLSKPNCQKEVPNVSTVCIILINIGLGDAIMATSFIRSLKQSAVVVDVIVAKKTVPLFLGSNDIENVILFDDEIACQRRKYDLVIDPYSHCGWYATYKYLKLLSILKYNYLSGFDVRLPKKYSDNYIPEDKKIHITDYYRYISNQFIDNPGVFPENYILPFTKVIQSMASDYISSLPEHTLKVAICPFASTPKRSFSDFQLNEMLKLLSTKENISIVLLMEKNKLSEISLYENTYFFEAPDFISAAAVLCQCDFVVSVDTSFVHVANCGNKPSLVFYNSVYNDGYNTDDLCGPNYPNARQIINNQGISAISPQYIHDEIINSLDKLITS